MSEKTTSPDAPAPARQPNWFVWLFFKQTYLREAGFGPLVAKGWIPWSILALVVSVVLIFLGQLLGLVVIALGSLSGLYAFGEVMNRVNAQDLFGLSVVLYLTFGMGTVLTLAWTKLIERRSLGSIGFTAVRPFTRFFAGFAWGVAFLAAVLGAGYLLGGYTIAAPASAWGDAGQMMWIAIILGGFIVQGSTEEIIIRGWLMSALAARIGGALGSRAGLIGAVVLSSVVFSLLHGANAGVAENPLSLVNIALFGLFIALYALREGAIWGACGWHASWNWALGTGVGLEVSGNRIDTAPWAVDLAPAGDALISGGTFGPEASVITTVVLTAGCVVWGGLLVAKGLGARRDGLYG